MKTLLTVVLSTLSLMTTAQVEHTDYAHQDTLYYDKTFANEEFKHYPKYDTVGGEVELKSHSGKSSTFPAVQIRKIVIGKLQSYIDSLGRTVHGVGEVFEEMAVYYKDIERKPTGEVKYIYQMVPFDRWHRFTMDGSGRFRDIPQRMQ